MLAAVNMDPFSWCIGTSTPTHKLTVYGDGDDVPENNSIAIISDTNPQLMALGNSPTSKPSINLFNDFGNFDINDVTTFKGNQISTDGEYFQIISFNGDVSYRLCISSVTGNVGIGVTSPISKLDVDGDITCHNLYFRGSSSSSGLKSISDLYGDIYDVMGIQSQTTLPSQGITYLNYSKLKTPSANGYLKYDGNAWIVDNTVSSGGGSAITYSAGTGIDITNNVIRSNIAQHTNTVENIWTHFNPLQFYAANNKINYGFQLDVPAFTLISGSSSGSRRTGSTADI